MRIVRFAVALTLLAGAVVATAAPASAFPPGVIGSATINATTFKPGARVIVKVENTTPGGLTMQIFSAPVTIGTGVTGPGGRGTVEGFIPAGYSGAHTIQVTGAGGEIYSFAITVATGGGGGGSVNCLIFTGPPSPQTDRHTVDVPGCANGTPGDQYTFSVTTGLADGHGTPNSDWTATLSSIAAADGTVAGGQATDSAHDLPCGVSAVIIDVLDHTGAVVAGESYGIDVQCADSGLFRSLAPARVLDTRIGNGAPTAKVGAGKSLTVQLTGRGGLPATGVGSVVLNATVTNPTAGGYISVYPAGGDTPLVSNLNFVAKQTVPNAVTVPVSASGKITLYNGSGGTVDLVADVSGYFLAGTPEVPGAFASVAPSRVLDTRTGNGAPKAKVGAGKTLSVQLTGRGGIPATGVASVVMNTTVTNATGSGYLTAFPAGTDRPVASSLNFVAGQTVPNAVIVPVGSGGKVSFYNGSSGSIDLLADVAGYYLAGTATEPGAFVAVTPARVLDTRTGNGAPKHPVARGASLDLPIPGRGGLPVAEVGTVVLNTTVTNATGAGYITVYPAGGDRPVVSSLNFVARQTVPNVVTVPIGRRGYVTLYNGSSGTVDLLADVAGYYLAAPPA